MIFLQYTETICQVPELFPDPGRVISKSCHSHYTANPHIFEFPELFRTDHVINLRHAEAEFCLLHGNIYLKETVDYSSNLLSLSMYNFEKPESIDRLNHGNEGNNRFYLICLEMSYEV